MRRLYVVGPCIAVALGIACLAWSSRAGHPLGVIAAIGQAPESPLPIKQVVLFNSGVGYLQREGDVQGDSRVDLSFPASDISDLLKSLVLQDLGGGRIGAVSYDSQDPVDKILRSFAIDLNTNPTFGQILNQARGERIEIQLQSKDKAIPGRLVGTIVGMETRAAGDGKQPIDVLNLLTQEGLQNIPLEQFLGVRFHNPALEGDFQRALKVLAGSHDMQKKTVSLGFNGAGKRAVRVGYVVERPIWKTTYRLRIEPKGKATLQGWAIVENTSDDDWNDVRMVLVSGRPISFQMNLYDPLYMPRPTVEPEQFASLRPPVYEGTMGGNPFAGGGGLGGGGALGGGLGGALGGGGGGAPVPVAQGGPAPLYKFMPGSSLGGMPGAATGGGYLGGLGLELTPEDVRRIRNAQVSAPRPILNPYQQNPSDGLITSKLTYEDLQRRRQELEQERKMAGDVGPAVAMDFKEGVRSVATSDEVGDYHHYVIDQKISLSRQKSAMLPIVDQAIEGAKVSIYNESVHTKYPLLGLRLKNTSGQPLTQGPITVYDAGTYAGDTRILDLQKDEERLLSYALDQAVEVKATTATSPSPEMTFKIDEAGLTAHYKERETRTYAIKNRAAAERLVIIEHPIRETWTLVEGTPVREKTRDMVRFEIKVAAGATAKLVVAEEQPRTDDIASVLRPRLAASTGIEMKADIHVAKEKLLGLKAVLGLLVPKVRIRETKSFFVQNNSEVDRDFTIDHIVRKDWTLSPGGDEKPIAGPNVYRFKLHAPKGKTAERDLFEEKTYDIDARPVKELGDAKLREYLADTAVSDRMKTGLTKVLDLRRRLGDGSKRLGELSQRLKAMTTDQARLRDNLHVIPQTAEPYKDFLKKFVTQEAEIETLQRQVREAEATLRSVVEEQQAFLATWTAE